MTDDLIERLRYPVNGMRPTLTEGRAAADALTAAQARIAELEAALTSMVYRHEIYCGGPDLPFAGHTDKKLMRLAKKALKTKGQEQ